MISFYRSLTDPPLPRKRLRSIAAVFHSTIGPLLSDVPNEDLLPNNAHQVKRLIQASDRLALDNSLISSEPHRVTACSGGHIVFNGDFAERRACPHCLSIRAEGKTVFFNSLQKRLRQVLNSSAAHLYRNNHSIGVDGFVGNACDGRVHQRVMEGSGPYDQAISLHNDSAAMTTFNGRSFTPVVVVFQNLPAEKRFKAKYLYTSTLWKGHAPSISAQAYLSMLASELKVSLFA